MLRSFFICITLPWVLWACASVPGGAQESSAPQDPLSALIDFYRGPLDHLSAVRRGQCPMYPSCSEYARQSIRKHGPLIGWMMACDRLMRCGRDETQRAPRVRVDGEWKLYDPVEENDRWWSGADAAPGAPLFQPAEKDMDSSSRQTNQLPSNIQ